MTEVAETKQRTSQRKKKQKKKANSLPRMKLTASGGNVIDHHGAEEVRPLTKSAEMPKEHTGEKNKIERTEKPQKTEKEPENEKKKRKPPSRSPPEHRSRGMRRSERLKREIKRLQRIKQELEKEKYQHGLIQKDFERIKHIRTTIDEDLDRNRRKQLAIIKAKSKTWSDMGAEIQQAKEEIKRKKAREAWTKEYAAKKGADEERKERYKKMKEKEREREKEREKERVKRSPREKEIQASEANTGNVSPKLTHRVRLLDKWMKHRPTWSEDVEEKNKRREKEITENINEVRRNTFRSSAELLQLLLSNRPSSQELELRGILKDEEKSERKKRKIEERLERELSNKQLEKEIELTIRDSYYHPCDDWLKAEKAAMEMLMNENKKNRGSTEVVGEGEEELRLVRYCDIVFHPDGRLGGGSFGDVFLAVVPGVPGRVAVKILKGRSAKCEQAFSREIEALKRTRASDYTVKLRGWSCDVHYCIITELCEGGSLESIIHKQGYKPTIEQAVRIGTKIVEAMNYLHTLDPPVLHRDVSPGNIFLHPDIDGRVCIGDFGIAVMKTEKRNSLRLSKNGNPRYRAPEVSKGEPYSRKADVYSFGNLFFELLTGIKPFAELESGQITFQIISGETPHFPRASRIPKELRRLTKQCWAMDPSERPSFAKLLARLSEYTEQRA